MRGVFVPLLLCGLSFGAPVFAQARGEPSAASEARVLFKRGDYEGALAALERAQREAPDPRLFWNMAACENKLGRHAKAIAYVERYLAATPNLTEAERKQGADFLKAASTYVGKASVISELEGVRVLVDGEFVGTTPLSKPLLLDEGERRVRFERSGHRASERTERVLGGGEVRWVVALEPETPPVADKPLPTVPPKSATPPPAPAAAQPAPPERSPSRVGPIVLGATGIAIAATGGVLVGTSLSKASELEAECRGECAPSRWESERTKQLTGNVLLGAGAAVLVTAGLWWALTPAPRARVAIAPSLGGLVLRGSL